MIRLTSSLHLVAIVKPLPSFFLEPMLFFLHRSTLDGSACASQTTSGWVSVTCSGSGCVSKLRGSIRVVLVVNLLEMRLGSGRNNR